MTRLTDQELEGFEYHGMSSGTQTALMVRDCITRACAELRERRAADAETQRTIADLEDALAVTRNSRETNRRNAERHEGVSKALAASHASLRAEVERLTAEVERMRPVVKALDLHERTYQTASRLKRAIQKYRASAPEAG